MNVRQLFPLGKAYGQAFCNREAETEKLVGNVKGCKHTLLIAPRRYGKSSLAERAIKEAKYPSIRVNFHLCTSDAEIAELVLDNIVKLIGVAVGKVEKLMASIKKYLSNIEPLMSFGGNAATLKLLPKKSVNYSVVISEALLLVEKLLAEKKKQAVIFFDEFQEITHIDTNGSIEGAFRTAAQEMQHLSIIFSGSLRSLLLSMFDDEKRPLYKLCRKIKLDRIGFDCYQNHIQKIAKQTWGSFLDDKVFTVIMDLTNRHPYYVNYLCDAVWAISKNLPTESIIYKAWQEVLAEEWSDTLKEISDLPINQRRVLKYLANSQQAMALQSQEVSLVLRMATSSISTATTVLLEKDYIEKDENKQYQIINPLLAAVLRGAED